MKKRLLAFVVCLIFSAALCACAAPAATDEPTGAASESAAVSESAPASESAQSSESADTSEEAAPPESASAAASAFSGTDAALEGNRSITDMAGRSVDIPMEITKVYSTTPVGGIFVYTLDPELLLGWSYELTEQEKMYIQAEYRDLPVYGMNDTLNIEALIAAAPDVILQVGSLSDSAAEQADALSEQTGIPVLMYSVDLDKTALVYEQLGLLLEEEDRALQLAEYSGRIVSEANDKTATIPEDSRVTVYYGNGPDSLNTAPQGSDAMEVIEIAGGVNCAAIELQADESPTERVDISAEQLLAWNPDIMFVNGEPTDGISAQAAADAILNNPTYTSLQAVANGEVHGIPQVPFSWLDRPKGPNRIIGILWAGSVMYPDLYTDDDVTKDIQDFYSTFYHVDITPEEIAQLPSD